MNLPIYNSQDVERASITGERSLFEFHEYIGLLIESDYVQNEVVLGILRLVYHQGTSVITPKQAKVLSIVTDQFPMEHCIRCGEVVIVRAGEEPGFCDSCLSFISRE